MRRIGLIKVQASARGGYVTNRATLSVFLLSENVVALLPLHLYWCHSLKLPIHQDGTALSYPKISQQNIIQYPRHFQTFGCQQNFRIQLVPDLEPPKFIITSNCEWFVISKVQKYHRQVFAILQFCYISTGCKRFMHYMPTLSNQYLISYI